MHILNFSWTGQTVWMYQAILYIAVACILPCKLNYGYYNQAVFINIFQTEHFSAVKCHMVMRKIWASLWYQNLQKFEKKLKS